MTTPLLIALLAGPPLALLALAIAYAAHVLALRHALAGHTPGHVLTAPDTAESGPPARDVKIIEDLQHSITDLQRQLLAQRDALTALLSERREEHPLPTQHTQSIAEPVTESVTESVAEPADTLSSPRGRTPARTSTTRSGARRSSIAGTSAPADSAGDVGAPGWRVRQLLAEGMPERSIARELRIGVEEVQLLATSRGAGRAS